MKEEKQVEQTLPEYLVCIGASAGGLSACQQLISQLTSPKACYVYCQHLSPTHESMLVEILAKSTDLTVKQVVNDDPIVAGCFYIIPPGCDVELEENKFRLYQPPQGPHPKPNIDKFFVSIAENFKEKCIAIILSGSGSDGAIGITSIRSKGGLVFVQSPETSSFDGMPSASINTQMVDAVKDLSVLGDMVTRIIEHSEVLENSIDQSELDIFASILQVIKDRTDYNFSSYRETTIRRRIARRMSICGVSDIYAYKQFLEDNESEVNSFVKDAFIIVSEFYRDPEEFDVLRAHLVDRFKEHPQDQQFRVWVPGCATGEEAYTIAMMIEDIKRDNDCHFDVKIMATDISTDAIGFARQGKYEEVELINIPDHWLSRYFDADTDGIAVKKHIRDKIIFSIHNVFSDPPFSKIHLVSCRNLLIYFDDLLQDKVISAFHFSLFESGLLFLGISESVKDKSKFSPVNSNSNSKLYTKLYSDAVSLLIPSQPKEPSKLYKAYHEKKKEDIEKKIIKNALDYYTPALIVADEHDRLVYTSGNISPLMSKDGVFFKGNVFDFLSPALKSTCRAMSVRVRRKEKSVAPIRTHIELEGMAYEASVFVGALSDEFPGWILISYVLKESESHDFITTVSFDDNKYVAEIEKELSSTRENLQVVIEELEIANEKLQVYNEELQSTNEEYQSTNEELQTVNEELQSTNEELLTVNDEYAQKTNEQAKLSSDLTNIQESLKIPVFVINTDYRIQRFTESCNEIIDIEKVKINDLFFALHWYSDIPDLKSLLKVVEREKEPRKNQVSILDRIYDCQISPYKNNDNEFDGYTIVFYETTGLKRSQEALAREKLIAQTTLHNIIEGVIRIRDDYVVEYANPAALTILNREEDDLVDKKIDKRLVLFDEAGDPVDIAAWIAAGEAGEVNKLSTVELKTQYGENVYVELTVSTLREMQGYVITIRDITEKQNHIKKLEWQSQHDSLTGLVNRGEMEARLERTILTSKRDSTESSLLYMDLDQFKVINDTCGHLAGDKLLQQLSLVLMEVVRSRDTLARLGGDEFALLLDKCSLADAENIAYKVQSKICEYRFAWQERVFRVGVSIGIVNINKDVNQVAEVLSDADAACYAAKEQGRNIIQIHSRDNELLEKQRLEMHRIADINKAIDEDGFKLYFQEIHNVSDNSIEMWEVLLRMFNGKGEFLPPFAFLPAAERFGLIVRIDYWVLENTIKSICGYINLDDHLVFPRVSINLSGYTLTDNGFIDNLASLLKKYAFPADNITFEITETAAISNIIKAKAFIADARSLGCHFALDDFGTGMSSLSYLRDLELDYLKIDASFIQNIVTDDIDSALVRSVTDVAHRLSLKVIAEGVETKAQIEPLENMGMDCIQGFYKSKPRPFEEFIAEVADVKEEAS